MKKCITKTNLMERVNPNTAGIDIGAKSIFVCAGFNDGHQEVREFLTFTADLKAAAAWLKECGVKSIAMESTGSYWIPPYEIFEDAGFEVLLVNAHHLKAVPGKKTDVLDCQWIQQLHTYGLLRGSFRPKDECLTLRAYVRQRSKLVELSATQLQLMNKALIQMNMRLDHVFSEIAGASSLAIIRDIVVGERDAKKLAAHRDFRCKNTVEDVIKALGGNFRPEHLFSLKQALNAYDFIQAQLAECGEEIKKLLEKWSEATEKSIDVEKQDSKIYKAQRKNRKNAYHFDARPLLEGITKVDLTTIPGIDANLAVKIISEIGSNMDPWQTHKQFVSWLGLCPGNKISGGRILNSRTVPTANRTKQAFLLAANALFRSPTALGAFFRRMRAKFGSPKAITATAHKIAKIVYHMLKEHKNFNDIGQDSYERKFRERRIASLKRQAKDMGFSLQPVEQSEPVVA